MKLLQVEVTNFASYSSLKFDFNKQGLALIYGDTGSGKSTLLDIVSWILWGTTAKNGAVDDVRSWTSDSATSGTLKLEANKIEYQVTRIRGSQKENDLYWLSSNHSNPQRGKDITETQKFLDQLLNLDYDVYNTAVYYNEYSSTKTFFDSSAKHRKELFEKIADLSFATQMAEKISENKKFNKNTQNDEVSVSVKLKGQLQATTRTYEHAKAEQLSWEVKKTKKLFSLNQQLESFMDVKTQEINRLEKLIDSFESTRTSNLIVINENLLKLKAFVSQNASACAVCHAPNKQVIAAQQEMLVLKNKQESLINQVNPHLQALDKIKTQNNPFQEKIDSLHKQSNPFLKTIKRSVNDLQEINAKLEKNKELLKNLEHIAFSLNQLGSINAEFRNVRLTQNIKHIETETNRYLETYFDSLLRVKFEIDNDNLQVTLQKNGYECRYRQLSKGQKCLLRLCFAVSVMQTAANNIGIKFNSLFFDEALDGLDTELKLKAFNLFSELEKTHETILIIDHSPDLQNLFNKKYHVSMVNDESYIEEV